jgi:NLR family CARD domain-containing protein 3
MEKTGGKKYERFKGVDSMHYLQYQRFVAMLLLFGMLLQSCRSGFHAVMEESNPPMRHDIGDHGQDSITSVPSMAIVPDSRISVPSMAIGPKEWKQYLGEVGAAPPLPANINEILNSSCPFWPGKQVKDTHLLVLVPATVDGRPFTLDLLGELIKDPQGGFRKAEFEIYGNEVRRELGAQSPGSSYWVLMTRDVLPGSRGKTYDAQKALVAAHVHYDIPYVLEAATAILLHHARIGERLYTDDPWTYTRCQEKVLGNKYPVVVGGFSSGGFLVLNYYFYSVYSSSFGVSCLRKF